MGCERHPTLKWALDLMTSQRRLLIAKSRDLMLSWSMVAYAVWEAQFRAPAEILIQSQTYEKAVALVSGRESPGYCRVLWEQQDEFLRDAYPLTKPSAEFAGDLIALEERQRHSRRAERRSSPPAVPY